MRLTRLASWLDDRVAVLPAARGEADPELRRACFDSRRVERGDLFCALPGVHGDGAEFVAAALECGAAAVLVADPPCGLPVPALRVAPGHRPAAVAGCAAAHLAGEPARGLWVGAVTGTNGKTTVAHLLAHALETAGVRTARLGTLGMSCGGIQRPAGLTTPPADEIQACLEAAWGEGARAVVLEASSHGLAQDRLAGTPVDVAGWTNLTHDHLDFHGSLEEYAAAKARLVQELPAGGVAFLPAADSRVAAACAGAPARCVPWSVEDSRAPLAAAVRCGPEGTELEVSGSFGRVRITSALVGRHNAENLLLAYGMARTAGLRPEEAAAGLSTAAAPPGRLEAVVPEAPWRLFVDYAHTPDALARVLAALRESWPGARLGVVFGAGGDRDPTKRAPMGRAAAEGSDWCLVTSDNPRSEDPASIAATVAEGVRQAGGTAEVEVDRRAAIRSAVARLQPGEVLLVAGKGHEPYQETEGVRSPFDDRLELEEAARCSA